MIELIVGIIADTAVPDRVDRVLGDLRALQEIEHGRCALRVLLLANPSAAPNPRRVAAVLDPHRAAGLDLSVLQTQQAERLPIAPARTLLQRQCARTARDRSHACAWILDEDLRLLPLLADARRGLRLSDQVAQARLDSVDVLLSPILGAPPLPARSTVRVNLEDVYRHLLLIGEMAPHDLWLDRRRDNQRVRGSLAEYYYDYSGAHGDAAASPMWLEPAHPRERVRDAYVRLCEGSTGLIHGQPLTRDVRVDGGAQPPLPLSRGGNTLVLNLDLIERFPNLSAQIRGRVARRSDMIWARLVQSLGRAHLRPGRLLATQDRRGPGRSDFSAEKLLDDVRGSALVKAVDCLLASGAEAHTEALGVYVHQVQQRLRLIRWSESQVTERLQHILHLLGRTDRWFTTDESCAAATQGLRRAIDELLAVYRVGPSLPATLDDAEHADVRAFLGQLGDLIAHAGDRHHRPLQPNRT